jgi:hypothetical protein
VGPAGRFSGGPDHDATFMVGELSDPRICVWPRRDEEQAEQCGGLEGGGAEPHAGGEPR